MTFAAEIAKLETLSTAELAAEYERLHGKKPRYRSPAWLRKRIAYQLQVAAYGGLSRAARAEVDRLAADLRLPACAPQARTRGDVRRESGRRLRPGTVLRREWHGRQIVVDVRADGFVYEGEIFNSLSAVAKRVTGQHWSGPRFFNLVGRGKK